MRRYLLQNSALLLHEVKVRTHNLNKIHEEITVSFPNTSSKGDHSGISHSVLWIPHPRTGIYYPEGHEWVMEDVPNGASSFAVNYWLRSSEVEHM
ncbi:F-box/RNI superfamily protein [Rhynchospora pubera]|uniref:F-box/RNI superfamily protein n=1 Tax=Rhynchospora pubera TaxID=906938 RepID=A0AAV8HRA2_9POAL|nr:F-box/RNI superfamily protein [Rhynchospora pubera]